MKQMQSIFIVADGDGSLARIPGDFALASYNMPRSVNLSPQKMYHVTGKSFAVEYDSTGEVYVIFRNQYGAPVSDTVLLVRGMAVNVEAAQIEVVGLRRAGVVRVTVGADYNLGPQLSNSPSGLTDFLKFSWPVGVNGTTGPAGWTTIADPMGETNAFLAYSPSQTLDISAVLQGGARRYNSGAPTLANYYRLQYGFVDIQGSEVIRFWSYYDRVIDTASNGGTNGVDAQAYWFPAIMWQLTAAGVTANTPSVTLNIETTATYLYKRGPVFARNFV